MPYCRRGWTLIHMSEDMARSCTLTGWRYYPGKKYCGSIGCGSYLTHGKIPIFTLSRKRNPQDTIGCLPDLLCRPFTNQIEQWFVVVVVVVVVVNCCCCIPFLCDCFIGLDWFFNWTDSWTSAHAQFVPHGHNGQQHCCQLIELLLLLSQKCSGVWNTEA